MPDIVYVTVAAFVDEDGNPRSFIIGVFADQKSAEYFCRAYEREHGRTTRVSAEPIIYPH